MTFITELRIIILLFNSIKQYKQNVRKLYNEMLKDKYALLKKIEIINKDVQELQYECKVREAKEKELEEEIEERNRAISGLENKIKDKELHCEKKCDIITCADNGWNKVLSDAKESIRKIKKGAYERNYSGNK